VKLSSLALLSALTLAACGGGGGGGSTGGGGIIPPGPGPTPCPAGYTGTPPNCIAPTISTTATGKLVDDPSGAPLAGVRVALAPWTPGAAAVPQTTTAADGTFTFTAPNGHYLLYIGSDSPTDTTRPTIHDNITLTGGAQTLRAPTNLSYSALPVPAVEATINYRLTTQDTVSEFPCMQRFESNRTARSLPPVILDEWLLENARSGQQWQQTNPRPGLNPSNPYGALSTGNIETTPGNCVSMIDTAFTLDGTYSTDPRTLWFGAQGGATGLAEYRIDPRAFTDPNVPNWP